MLNQKLMGKTSEDKQFVEELFSTYLYTGNGSTQTINNGIDLAGKGGLVWIKSRSGVGSNALYDTARGARQFLSSNTGDQQFLASAGKELTSFDANGFTLGSNWNANVNSANNYASWTFRKAPKFFDVVTFTGNGVAGRQISHSLGQVPGMIIVKQTSAAADWYVYHSSLGNGRRIYLNLNEGQSSIDNSWNYTSPTSSVFTLGGTGWSINDSGKTYVAYLFAHDTTTDGLIQCGSFTTDSSGNATVNLGWEPQYIMTKRTDGTSNWEVFDTMRGWNVGGSDAGLTPNTYNAEASGTYETGYPTSTGFYATGKATNSTYIYMAIRRGPMKTPTDGTKVFSPLHEGGTGSARNVNAGFPIDSFLIKDRTSLSGPSVFGSNAMYDRLRGNSIYLQTQATSAEAGPTTGYECLFNSTQNGVNVGASWGSYGYREFAFRRAPGFFDVVCYTGTGADNQRVQHNLKTAPELIIQKSRSNSSQWWVYTANGGIGKYLSLQSTNPYSDFDMWGSSAPSAYDFGFNNASLGISGWNFVTYLFASCPGVSKVFSFTGNGTNQTINCGFTNGARFVLIKRTDSTGDWYVWDTARGIVAGNDPHLSLNTTAAEVTTDDTIDPDSSGFIVNQVAATNVNVNGASYIYLAIA